MAGTFWKQTACMTTWGLALWGALLISEVAGDWGHGICGPWGCGPPIQALVACHIAWLVVLLPASELLQSRVSRRIATTTGMAYIMMAIAGLLAVAVYEGVTWLPLASGWQRAYFWHRVGFVIATMIDLPLVELLLSGMWLVAFRKSPISDQLH